MYDFLIIINFNIFWTNINIFTTFVWKKRIKIDPSDRNQNVKINEQ